MYRLALPSWEPRMYDMLIYESLREGIEDSGIIATLRKAIQENPGQVGIITHVLGIQVAVVLTVAIVMFLLGIQLVIMKLDQVNYILIIPTPQVP